MPLIPALLRQKQADIHEFEAGLVYMVISRTARPVYIRLCPVSHPPTIKGSKLSAINTSFQIIKLIWDICMMQ